MLLLLRALFGYYIDQFDVLYFIYLMMICTKFSNPLEFFLFSVCEGHSNISQHDKDNERLGKWIKNQ